MKRSILGKLFIKKILGETTILLGALAAIWSTPVYLPNAHGQTDADVSHLPPAPSDGEAGSISSGSDSNEAGSSEAGSSEDPDSQVVSSAVVTIPSPVPYYIDRGVTMAPMRPLCGFLGIEMRLLDRVLTLTQKRGDDAAANRVVTLRIGGHSAQIIEGGETRVVALGLPAETRLGNTFLPVRFMKDTFGVVIGFRARDNALVIRDDSRTGVLSPPVTTQYNGSNASTITITNRVGRALSLRLSGPQSIILELGKNQSLTRRVRPGVYYYKGGSAGMQPRSGARRLVGGRRATWTWGRR